MSFSLLNFFVFGITPQEYSSRYGHVGPLPYKAGQRISTQLPKNIAVIRAVASVALNALTSYAAYQLGATMLCWPIAIAGLAFTGWTIYTHLLSKDPLMECFYKIAGGKNNFDTLPSIHLEQAPDETIFDAIKRISWSKEGLRIAVTKTLDGRNVIVIQGERINKLPTRTDDMKAIFAFIEKIGPNDLPRIKSNISEFVESILWAIFHPHEGNKFCQRHFHAPTLLGSRLHEYRDWNVVSHISSEMANELYVQCHIVK